MDRCEVATLSGSSMATPAVGGMATLIRQYFMDGYYPTGGCHKGSRRSKLSVVTPTCQHFMGGSSPKGKGQGLQGAGHGGLGCVCLPVV